MHGKVLWTELNTRNPEAAKAFYTALYGWEYEVFDPTPTSEPPYYVIMQDGAPAGGIFTMPDEMGGVPEHWFTNFGVEDIDASIEALKTAGGQIVRGKFHIPGVGQVAIVSDSGGAVFGMVQPDETAEA